MIKISKYLVYLLGLIFIKPFLSRKPWDNPVNSNPRNILYITLAYRGDLILNLPAIKAVKMKFPSAKITCWVKNYNKEMAELCPHIDEILEYENFPIKGPSIFKAIFARITHESFIRKLKSMKFDMCIDDSGYAFTALSTYFAGIPCRLGRNSQGFGFLYHFELPYDFDGHLIKKRFDLLKPLGIVFKKNYLIPEINIPEELINDVKSKVSDNIIDQDYFTVQVTAGWPAKNWSIKKFADVISRFNAYTGLLPVFIGAPNDNEIIDNLIGIMSIKAFNSAGLLSLTESAALISKAKLHFGVDSIGSHLAASTGVKSLTIFGPTNPGLIAILTERNIAIQKRVFCSPDKDKIYCSRDAGRKCDNIICMKELNSDTVFNFLVGLYNSKKLNSISEV